MGFPGLMMTMQRTSTPSALAFSYEERMAPRSVPQFLDSSR